VTFVNSLTHENGRTDANTKCIPWQADFQRQKICSTYLTVGGNYLAAVVTITLCGDQYHFCNDLRL